MGSFHSQLPHFGVIYPNGTYGCSGGGGHPKLWHFPRDLNFSAPSDPKGVKEARRADFVKDWVYSTLVLDVHQILFRNYFGCSPYFLV